MFSVLCCLLFISLIYKSNGLLEADYTLMKTITDMNVTLQQTVADLRNTNIQLTNTISEMNATIQRLEQGHMMRTQQIIFYAFLSTGQSLGQNQAIEFDKVVTNIGHAYDARHGHFIAPVSGYYHFSATIMTVGNQYIYVDMVKNGVAVAHLYGANAEPQSSGADVNLALEPNDMVWMKHTQNDHNTLNGGYCFFSGFLISQRI